MIKLGSYAKDRITNFSGVVTGPCQVHNPAAINTFCHLKTRTRSQVVSTSSASTWIPIMLPSFSTIATAPAADIAAPVK